MASPGQTNTANGPPGVVAGKNTMSMSQPQQQQSNNFDPLDKSSSNTLKRNPKMELCKTDLLKLLGYLEGELQARDVVIAALKSEKMKHLLNSRYRSGTSDPYSALARDTALVGGTPGPQLSQIDHLSATLEALVSRQRRMLSHMAKILKSAELRHRLVLNELEEEMQKHEHDTAEGDDITYGLEKERSILKKELEVEKQEKKCLEVEVKKVGNLLEEEKKRHKQIVLVLLAERKKIILKYIEERKRSEDLAQILSEEKVRTDGISKGLEEESKKSLLMEAEIEEQQLQFDICKSDFLSTIYSKDKKLSEQQSELEKLRAELELIKDQQLTRGTLRALGNSPAPPLPPAKPLRIDSMLESHKKDGKILLDLEEQQLQFEICKTDFLDTIFHKDKKLSEQQIELEKLRAELELLKDQQVSRGIGRAIGITPPPPPVKPANLAAIPTLRTSSTPPIVKGAVLGSGTPMVSSKIVQPTSTVSSVPVSGPTTGIARSVTPGQTVWGHCVNYGHGVTINPTSEITTTSSQETATTISIAPLQENAAAQALHKRPAVVLSGTSAAVSMSSGTTSTLTVKKLPIVQTQASSTTGLVRGAPPPVPPNKPIVPPKKEIAAVFLRRAEQQQEHKQFIKQNAITGSPTAIQPHQNQQNQPIISATNDDEAKPR